MILKGRAQQHELSSRSQLSEKPLVRDSECQCAYVSQNSLRFVISQLRVLLGNVVAQVLQGPEE